MTAETEQRTQHPCYMHDAVLGQPDAIAALLEREKEPVASLAGRLAGAERIHLVGIGTSWHAALVGEHLPRTVAGREDARAWNSFEFSSYPPALSARDAVVVLSRRGTMVHLVPLQLFAYWLATELEHDPDVFRLDDPTHLAARDHYTL